MKTPSRLLLAALPLLVALSGCKKIEMFDPGAYNDLVRGSFPVGNIDHSHSWRLWSEGSVSVTCLVEGASTLLLLTGDPTASEAEVLGQLLLPADGQTGRAWLLLGLVPKTSVQTYVAALDADDRLLAVKRVPRGTSAVSLSGADAPPEGAAYRQPRRQRVHYLYEASFPQPGDWDYNDLVLTLDAPEPVRPSANVGTDLAERQVRLHVTLRALGTRQQVAAAIRLSGVKRDRVEDVATDSYMGVGLQRNTDYPPTLLPEEGTLLKSRRNSEAVVALFDDAHLAFNPERQENAQPYRFCYNVSHDVADDIFREAEAPEADYVITFASAQEARAFSLSRIDPFIIVDYNGAKWEIHDYPDRAEQTLHSYGTKDQDNFSTGVSWALSVPYASFRHAVEGQPLGASDGPNAPGAYPDWAAWVQDCNAALDWPLRPNESKVY